MCTAIPEKRALASRREGLKKPTWRGVLFEINRKSFSENVDSLGFE